MRFGHASREYEKVGPLQERFAELGLIDLGLCNLDLDTHELLLLPESVSCTPYGL
ncbi:MAG: hypothetical protein L0Y66_05495 [Myxococcaceae bacterium]|nr:hypothetical protein [Myxococcaceae bacterium]MCI0671924.1 hypothetical protein [Myxococcaceae bacterium]